jgi:ornithine--oxo-acid transaminase
VRGRGLMVAIEFGRPDSWKLKGSWAALKLARKGLFAQTVVHALFHRHRILTQVSGDHIEVIKLIPPLIIGEPEIDYFIKSFTDVMQDAHRPSGLIVDFGRSFIAQARTPLQSSAASGRPNA